MAVFAGARLRDNNAFGTITDSPLAAGAVTLNSAGLANVSAVSGNHVALVLDPLRSAGAPEIVIVTAHTGAATSATITRGAYGTVARSHAAGVLWVLAATADDLIRICTSSTRPTDAYEGQLIFETDTNKYVGHGGVDWAPRDAGGQLNYAQVVAAQNGITAGPTDLTSLSVAVTVGTGRRIKITGHGQLNYSDATTGHVIDVLEGAVTLGRVGGSPRMANTDVQVFDSSVILSPSAGAHTYKLSALRYVGAGNLNLQAAATNPAFILVEDIGAA